MNENITVTQYTVFIVQWKHNTVHSYVVGLTQKNNWINNSIIATVYTKLAR